MSTETKGGLNPYAPPSTADASPPKQSMPILFWAGWIVTVLPALMLVMSAVMKFVKPKDFVDAWAKFGYPDNVATGIGIVELVCTLLYVIPRTSVLGAILLTGYLGGATATHVRVEDPYFAPIILGVFIWLGLFLRDARLRALLPLRS